MEQTFLTIYGVFSAFLFMLAGFIFFKITPELVKKSEYYVFRGFILIFLFYLIMNALWTLQEFDAIHFPRGVYAAVCFLSYISVVGNAFFFYAFTMIHFDFNLGKTTLATILGLLPFTAAFVLLCISLKNGMIFYIDENVHLHTGKAYLALAGCAFLYFAVIARVSLSRVIRTKGRYAKREGLILFGCVVFLTGWVLLDGLFERFTIIPIAIYSVINFLFVHLLSSQINTDALTDMNNRRKSEEYLNAQLETVSDASPIYLYIADINSFKQINDTHGHLEGDNVLILVADVIKGTLKKRDGFSARYGGDEFIWTQRPGKNETFSPDDIVNEIQNGILEQCKEQKKPYTISLCVGYVRCSDPKKKISAYVSDADEKLYENKRRYHTPAQ